MPGIVTCTPRTAVPTPAQTLAHTIKHELDAGQRAALNLSGVEKAEIKRGDVLVHPDTLDASRLLDVSLKVLPGEGRGLKNWAEVRFHTGTAEVIGNR